jgi:adenylate cyclase
MLPTYFFRLLFLVLLSCGIPALCQEAETLKNELSFAREDTTRCRILNELIEAEADDNVWPAYNDRMKLLAEKNLGERAADDPQTPVFKKYLGAALNNTGVVIQNKGNSKLSLQYYLKSLRLREEVRDSSGIGETLNNIGLIHHAQGNIPLAIDYYQKSLKIQELIDDYTGMSTTILNLGVISSDQGDYTNALTYFLRSYELQERTGDEYGKAHSLHNLSRIYQRKGNFEKALRTIQQSLEIRRKIQDTKGIAYSLFNMGNILSKMDTIGETKVIQKEYLESLAIFEKLEDKEGVAYVMNQLAELYFKNREYMRALDCAERALSLGKELGYPEQIRNASHSLYLIHKAMKQEGLALAMYELYSIMRDSISNEELRRLNLGKQYQYEFDKRTTADSVKAVEQQKVMAARISKEKTQRFAVTGVLLLTVVFSGFIFNRWRIIKKQKLQIQQQHTALGEEKKKSDDLLLNILPEETAEELKRTGRAKAMRHEQVSVMFTDFENFTQASEKMSAEELVNEIHYCYSAFDRIISAYPIEKIKTIGDGYMCAAGLPLPNVNHAVDLVRAALDIRTFMKEYQEDRIKNGRVHFVARIGIHSGPVVAGVVGTKKFAYDIWGDTVNLAARMEAGGVPGMVNISESTMELVKNYYETEYRGNIEVKNKGEMKMYFVKAVNEVI